MYLLKLFSIVLFFIPLSVSAFEVPPLKGFVNDKAHMISYTTESKLSAALLQLRQKGGSEIAILTVPSLDGLTIEEASIKITDQWKLGTAEKDNGALLLIAKKERRVRIEVGQGLEGDLTDAHSKRIIDEVMVPLFRRGNIDEGITLGVYQIAVRANPNLNVQTFFGNSNWKARQKPKRNMFSGFFVILILLSLITFILRFTRGHRSGSGSGFGGGFYGGGSSGGLGGFGGGLGGGGGFSGGGASGGW